MVVWMRSGRGTSLPGCVSKRSVPRNGGYCPARYTRVRAGDPKEVVRRDTRFTECGGESLLFVVVESGREGLVGLPVACEGILDEFIRVLFEVLGGRLWRSSLFRP
jgi:hypothetical protein